MIINLNGKKIDISDDLIRDGLDNKKEVSFDSEFVLMTNEENETFKANMRNEGVSSGIEIGRKNILKGLGLEVEGAHKDDERSLSAVNSFITNKINSSIEEMKIEPDKKVKELQKDLTKLRESYSSIETEKNNISKEFVNYKNNQHINTSISKSFPDNLIMSNDDMLMIFNSKIKTGLDENGNVFQVGSDGLPVKDNLGNTLPIDKAVNSFFEANSSYLKQTSGGAAGKDTPPVGGKQTLGEFTKECQDNNIQVNGPEFNKILSDRKEAGLIDL